MNYLLERENNIKYKTKKTMETLRKVIARKDFEFVDDNHKKYFVLQLLKENKIKQKNLYDYYFETSDDNVIINVRYITIEDELSKKRKELIEKLDVIIKRNKARIEECKNANRQAKRVLEAMFEDNHPLR